MPVKANQPELMNAIKVLVESCESAPGPTLRRQALGPASNGVSDERPGRFLVGPGRIQAIGDSTLIPPIDKFQTTELIHGRIEWRCLTVVSLPPRSRWKISWPAWAQVYRIERKTQAKRSGKVRSETVYGITSLEPDQADAKLLLQYTRDHWTIENKSHWVRDVTFGEDHSTVRTGSIPQVMAALRNATIGVARCAGHTNIAKACRFYAAQPRKALALIGGELEN